MITELNEFYFTGVWPNNKPASVVDDEDALANGYITNRRLMPAVRHKNFIIGNPELSLRYINSAGIFPTNDAAAKLLDDHDVPCSFRLPYQPIFVCDAINNLGQAGAYADAVPRVVFDEFVADAKILIDSITSDGTA